MSLFTRSALLVVLITPSAHAQQGWSNQLRLFVCQFECPVFFGLFGLLGLFKVSFCSMKMALVKKLGFLCLAFESNHPGAQKSLFSCHLDAS